MDPILLIPAAVFALSAAATPLTGVLARRVGAISYVNHRSSHKVPTPRLGGIALGGAFGLGALAWLLFFRDRAAAPLGARPAAALAIGWGAMFGLGLLDDCKTLPAKPKLLWMLGSLALAAGLGCTAIGWPVLLTGAVGAALGAALTFGWLLFFVNGFNFMDGMDGFATAFAIFASLAMAVCALTAGAPWDSPAPVALYMLAAAAWGFFLWNRPPARVFMGDAGSLSIGFTLAAAVPGLKASCGVPVVTALTILLPFVFDVALTLIRRARRGENLMEAHREHLYQRLNQTGWGHERVLYVNLAVFAASGASAWGGFMILHPAAPWAGLAAALAVNAVYWRWVLARERRCLRTDG